VPGRALVNWTAQRCVASERPDKLLFVPVAASMPLIYQLMTRLLKFESAGTLEHNTNMEGVGK
jgi:hypothetical protein